MRRPVHLVPVPLFEGSHGALSLTGPAYCCTWTATFSVGSNQSVPWSKGTPLKAEDLTALNAATNRLLDRPQLAVGDKESWISTKTGVAGTVTAGNPVQKKGLACPKAGYAINGPGSEPDRQVSLP
jgi:hypothetical protein